MGRERRGRGGGWEGPGGWAGTLSRGHTATRCPSVQTTHLWICPVETAVPRGRPWPPAHSRPSHLPAPVAWCQRPPWSLLLDSALGVGEWRVGPASLPGTLTQHPAQSRHTTQAVRKTRAGRGGGGFTGCWGQAVLRGLLSRPQLTSGSRGGGCQAEAAAARAKALRHEHASVSEGCRGRVAGTWRQRLRELGGWGPGGATPAVPHTDSPTLATAATGWCSGRGMSLG